MSKNQPWLSDSIVSAASEAPWSNDPIEGEKQESAGMMPFTNEAIANAMGMPVDLITRAINLIPGFDLVDPFMGSESIKKGMEYIGIDLPEKGTQPQALSEHIGRGVGEVATAMIPAGMAVKALSRGAGLTGQIANNIWRSMSKSPGLTMASEFGGGVGVGTGRAIGEAQFESPAAQTTAEIVGGVAGSMAPVAAAYSPTLIAIRTGKNILRKLSMPFTPKGAEYRAGRYAKEQVAQPTATARVIGEPTIGDLPPAVASGEKRLITLYKSLTSQDALTEAETIEKISTSILKLESEMRKMGYGSPELVEEVMRRRVNAIETRIDKRIMQSAKNAQDKLDSLPVARRKSEEAKIVRQELQSALKSAKAAEKKIWNEVPKDLEVGAKNARARYAEIYEDLSKAQRIDIPLELHYSPIIQKKVKAAGNWTTKKAKDGKITHVLPGKGSVEGEGNMWYAFDKKGELIGQGEIVEPFKTLDEAKSVFGAGEYVTNLREMHGLRSKLLETARIAGKDRRWNTKRIAEDMADAILEDIDTVSEASDALRAAMQVTKQNKVKFEQGIVGDILGYDKSGAPRIAPELTLEISIGRMAERGAVDINKVALSPQARQATERYLSRSFTDYSVDKSTNVLNPTKSKSWLKTNEAILDEFPELRTQLSDAASAQEIADNTRLLMEARKARLKDPKVSATAEALRKSNDETLNQSIHNVFTSNRPRKLSSELIKQAKKIPDGMEGLRGGVVDYMLEKASKGAFNELGEQTLSGGTMLNFIKRNKHILSVYFNEKQLSKMRKVGAELAKIERFQKTPASKAEIELGDLASSTLVLLNRIGGARLGGWLGRESAGGSIQMANIMSDRFKNFATRLTKDRAFALIHDAITSNDPKLLQALLLPIDKPQAQLKNLRIVNDRMNVWLAGPGKRVLDDIEQEIREEQ